MIITLEIEDNKIYIQEENSSGATYRCDTVSDIADAVKYYIENYLVE